MKDIFKGSLVRLSAFDPQEMAKAYAAWWRDSEFQRLASSTVRMHSAPAAETFFQKMLDSAGPADQFFSIRALADDRLLGDVNFEIVYNGMGRGAYVGIAIGARADWDHGYGTDAMRVLLRYAFWEINLESLSLTVFEYNPRAIRSYEKAGFQHEGRVRGRLLKDGRRWDMLVMSIQRAEWLAQNEG